MDFKKYQHIERFGTDEVDGIDIGTCYIFPKIDGTNASVWADDKLNICCGSRNRQLSLDDDNHGFAKYVSESKEIQAFLSDNPDRRLYGEFLVPHTLKTYRENAWRKFYVFDVMTDDGTYLCYDSYSETLEKYGIEFIPPLAVINNPSIEQLYGLLETNNYLIEDGKGAGEGIVLKRYDFKNKYGRVTWAKIVASEFKDRHRKTSPVKPTEGPDTVEQKIVEEFVTDAFIDKILASIDGWNSKKIPELLGKAYHELVTEETWHAVKKYKNPKIDFKKLQSFMIMKIKELKPDMF